MKKGRKNGCVDAESIRRVSRRKEERMEKQIKIRGLGKE